MRFVISSSSETPETDWRWSSSESDERGRVVDRLRGLAATSEPIWRDELRVGVVDRRAASRSASRAACRRSRARSRCRPAAPVADAAISAGLETSAGLTAIVAASVPVKKAPPGVPVQVEPEPRSAAFVCVISVEAIVFSDVW